MIDSLKCLADLMTLQLDQSMAQLRATEGKGRQLRDEISKLDTLSQTRFGCSVDLQARANAGADAAWQFWSVQRRTLLNSELALQAAKERINKEEARKRFLRDQASKSLLSNALKVRSNKVRMKADLNLLQLVITSTKAGSGEDR